jgi:hypothetical protein
MPTPKLHNYVGRNTEETVQLLFQTNSTGRLEGGEILEAHYTDKGKKKKFLKRATYHDTEKSLSIEKSSFIPS